MFLILIFKIFITCIFLMFLDHLGELYRFKYLAQLTPNQLHVHA